MNTKKTLKTLHPSGSKIRGAYIKNAIPIPPSYNAIKLLSNVFVIESESAAKQGTAFHLKNYGLITCDHCIRNEENDSLIEDLVIYKGNDISKKVRPSIVSTNKDLDIALLHVDKNFLGDGLDTGSSDSLKQLDHVAVAGYPNYNFGDNGYFSPGLVVGFRTFSGIRHILVNIPIISGNSGGPAFNNESKVIGVAVTGADKFHKAHETEKHGLIPIEVIKYL